MYPVNATIHAIYFNNQNLRTVIESKYSLVKERNMIMETMSFLSTMRHFNLNKSHFNFPSKTLIISSKFGCIFLALSKTDFLKCAV